MPHSTVDFVTMEEFVTLHAAQLKTCGLHERFWPSLFEKLTNQAFDAGENFLIQQVFEWDDDEDDSSSDEGDADELIVNGDEGKGSSTQVNGDADADESNCAWQVVVIKEDGISFMDPDQVYLIDHAWTFRMEQVRSQLESVPGLLTRMCGLMCISNEDKEKEELVEEVMDSVWKYNLTYSIGNAELGSEAAQPIWYIMDEFGSRIQHSDDPNFKVVPFFYGPAQMSFSIMWPLRNVGSGEEVTRNYIEGGVTNSLMRKIRLLPWHPEDMRHLSFEQHEVDESFFNKYKVHETLPNLEMEFPGLKHDSNIAVFTDVSQVRNGLTDPRFEFVDSKEKADIIWTQEILSDYKDFSEKSPGKFCNQFPFEMVLTVKDLLAMISRRAASDGCIIDRVTLESKPKWLPTTFNLKTELPQFVSYYQHREHKGLDNHWICKPWNLARALDSHVTGNLDYILRLPDTGPKITSKYISNPVLYDRGEIGLVKFDFRFVVMVTSTQPLHLFVHKKFLIRFANKPFSLDHFDDYQKHFTVMNYRPDAPLKEMLTEDFIEAFDEQYPAHPWSGVEESVHDVILDVFKAALLAPPPRGIGHCPQARTMYGVDVMLKWDKNGQGEDIMQPQLLEFNYGPDNTRLIRYYPSFLNDVFSTLFLDDIEDREVVALA